MPRLSIVIPALVGAEPLERTLVSVLQNRPRDCEVVVVHTGWYDDPYQLADEVRFVTLDQSVSELTRSDSVLRVHLANAGVRESAGRVVHLLTPGLEPEEGWADFTLKHFDDPQIWAATPLVLSHRGRIVSAGVDFTPGGARNDVASGRRIRKGYRLEQLPRLGPCLSAAFYRRNRLNELGGLDADLGDEMADVDAALAITRAGGRCVFEGGSRLIGTLPKIKRSAFQVGKGAELVYHRRCNGTLWTPSPLRHAVRVAAEAVFGFLFWPPTLFKVFGRAAGRWRAWRETRSLRKSFPAQSAKPMVVGKEPALTGAGVRDNGW